jgi:hypothetical protein
MSKTKSNKSKRQLSPSGSTDDEDNDDEDDLADRRRKITETTNYDNNTPLINCLMKIRCGNKTNNSSNHIAALIPSKDCFSQNYNSFTTTKGINSDKTKFGNKNVKTHAEMDVLRKTQNMFKCGKKKKRIKMSLVILRVNRNGLLCESAPCYHCTLQLSKSKDLIIDKIYFSVNGGKIVYSKFSEWIVNPPTHITKGWKVLERINNEKRKKKIIN